MQLRATQQLNIFVLNSKFDKKNASEVIKLYILLIQVLRHLLLQMYGLYVLTFNKASSLLSESKGLQAQKVVCKNILKIIIELKYNVFPTTLIIKKIKDAQSKETYGKLGFPLSRTRLQTGPIVSKQSKYIQVGETEQIKKCATFFPVKIRLTRQDSKKGSDRGGSREADGDECGAYRLPPDGLRGSMGMRGPQRSMHLIKN